MTLSNEVLWEKTYDARARERVALTELLAFLQEIERRKLHLARGFESLFTFLVKGLGYEEGSAYRRLQALRALRAVPELKNHLAQGSLTLTNVAAVQGLIKSMEKNRAVSSEEKRALFTEMQGQSKRGAEQLILVRAEKEGISLRGVTAPHDLIRATSPTRVEVRFEASKEFEEKIYRLKELYFKKRPGASLEELLTWAVDETLNRHDPIQLDERARVRESTAAARRVTEAAPVAPVQAPSSESNHSEAPARQSRPSLAPQPKAAQPESLPDPNQPALEQKPTPYRPHLPAATRRLILRRSAYRCEYRDSRTGRRCESTKALEIDHQVSLIFGGSSTPENLQVLCNPHHRAKGIAG